MWKSIAVVSLLVSIGISRPKDTKTLTRVRWVVRKINYRLYKWGLIPENPDFAAAGVIWHKIARWIPCRFRSETTLIHADLLDRARQVRAFNAEKAE